MNGRSDGRTPTGCSPTPWLAPTSVPTCTGCCTRRQSGQAARGPPLLVGFDVGVSEQQRVAGHSGLDRLVQHEAEDVLYFRLPAPFNVAQHRSRILRVLLGERLLP